MNLRSHLPLEKSAAAAGLLLLLMSAGWCWIGRTELRQLRAVPEAIVLSGADFSVAPFTRSERAVSLWPKPEAQHGASNWVYELFTPPDIYYDAVAQSFAASPPVSDPEGARPFGIELLQVKRAPYRLQLVGYFGASSSYTAVFSSPQSSGTFLAREGHRFDELGLALVGFSVRRVPVGETGDGLLRDVAVAVLRDGMTGEIVTLDSGQRKLTDTPLAVLRLVGASVRPRELREGDSLQDGTALYCVERIQLDPPEVVVSRLFADRPQSEARVLRLSSRPQGAAETRAGNPSELRTSVQAETGVASTAPSR